MKFAEHMINLKGAATASELETRMRFAHEEYPAWPRTFYRIKDAMEFRGKELCAAHPRGLLVPRFETRNRHLVVCGQSRPVAKGWNGAGIRYAWHDAEQFAREIWRSEGVSDDTATAVWEWWSAGYSHRALQAIDPDA